MVDAPSVLPQGHTNAVTSVAYSSDGTQLASGSGDNTVRIWDVASGECRATLKVILGQCARCWLDARRIRGPHTAQGGEKGGGAGCCGATRLAAPVGGPAVELGS